MKLEKVILVSPPFSSQLSPTLALARAFRDRGVETTVACGEQFKERILNGGVGFTPLLVNRNANTGVAQRTRQPKEEQKKLRRFLESTKRGAVETLILQSKDRKSDMFTDPQRLLEDIEYINARDKPDLWVANQLSYALTLVLYCLKLPFVTLCPVSYTHLTLPTSDLV